MTDLFVSSDVHKKSLYAAILQGKKSLAPSLLIQRVSLIFVIKHADIRIVIQGTDGVKQRLRLPIFLLTSRSR